MKISSRHLLALFVLVGNHHLQPAMALPVWLNCLLLRRLIVPRLPSDFNIECSSCGIGEWKGLFKGRFSTELTCDYGTAANPDRYGFDGVGTLELSRSSGILKSTMEWTYGMWSDCEGESFLVDLEVGFNVKLLDRSLEYTSCSLVASGDRGACYCDYESTTFPDFPVLICNDRCPSSS